MTSISVNRIFAHSVQDQALEKWETLQAHSENVASKAAEYAALFNCEPLARLAGLLHDAGKCSAEFQAYIRSPSPNAVGPNHAYAGALVALERVPKPVGPMLAAIIAGHHAGLADGVELHRRLAAARPGLPSFDGWEAAIGPLPDPAILRGAGLRKANAAEGFSHAFLIRMLFSCLVDADSIETEAFYARLKGGDPDRGGCTDLRILRDRLEASMARLAPDPATLTGPAADLNALRARVLGHARGKATEAPGLFTLTVPTGGGKTLTSLSFALDHAIAHGLRRVIYVIPFTSIIDQTAEVFRRALGPAPGVANVTDVLEHHASFDWDAKVPTDGPSGEDGRGIGPRERLQRAAENWDAPIVVTTAVQFFESLYGHRRSRSRKLHNIAGSVVILDEAQTLPLRLLRPCLAAIDELALNYKTSVVLCTATQPAVRRQDEFKGGLDIPAERELAPDPKGLFTALRRVTVERRLGRVGDEEIAARFAALPQMLCIVNRRAHAQELFARIRDLPGAAHLSTLMCPAHRRAVLASARERLTRGEPVRIVSTSVIEAGVDIDLPEVWRAAAGIDSILQAAGRCNREGRLPGLGRVVVFEPEDGEAPPDLEQAWAAGRAVLRQHPDPQTLDAIQAYFEQLYWQKGAGALDAARIDDACFPILEKIAERRGTLAFPFESIARAFRMIDETMESVVVPWRAGPDDRMAEGILRRIASMDRPSNDDLRRLQSYVVAIPETLRDPYLKASVLRPVHRALGDGLLQFESLDEYYDAGIGLNLKNPLGRNPERNIF